MEIDTDSGVAGFALRLGLIATAVTLMKTPACHTLEVSSERGDGIRLDPNNSKHNSMVSGLHSFALNLCIISSTH